MKTIFVGDVEFSKNVLKKLFDLNVDIIKVLSTSSKRNSDKCNLEPLCKAHNTAFTSVDNINAPEVLKGLRALEPDVIICTGISTLLSAEFLALAKRGVIGYHPAALPDNRGRHPLIWTLVLGLKTLGSTFFWMDEGADSGPIISQATVEVAEDDYAIDLYDKMTQEALTQLETFIPRLKAGEEMAIPQNLQGSNCWRKRSKPDGKIDFRMSSLSIYNLVRALSQPYPGAHFVYQGVDISVWKTRRINGDGYENIEPGKVVEVTDQGYIRVKTGDGLIELQEFDPALPLNKGVYL